MTDVERLRAQAKRCLRLAQQAAATDVAQSMYYLASEYLDQARALERTSGQQQQRGNEVPPPASGHAERHAQQQQQQQQIQHPKKEK
jgi:primosomal protein N''